MLKRLYKCGGCDRLYDKSRRYIDAGGDEYWVCPYCAEDGCSEVTDISIICRYELEKAISSLNLDGFKSWISEYRLESRDYHGLSDEMLEVEMYRLASSLDPNDPYYSLTINKAKVWLEDYAHREERQCA